MQTKDLPDLDKMTPAEIESAAEVARLDRMALDRICSILSQTGEQDKLDIATLAILLRGESSRQIRFSLENCSPELTEASRFLRRISDDEEKLALAIAILEGVQAEREGDAIVPPDCEFSEAMTDTITEDITLRGLQQLR